MLQQTKKIKLLLNDSILLQFAMLGTINACFAGHYMRKDVRWFYFVIAGKIFQINQNDVRNKCGYYN